MNVKKLEQLDILLVKDLYQMGEGRVRNNEREGVWECVWVWRAVHSGITGPHDRLHHLRAASMPRVREPETR